VSGVAPTPPGSGGPRPTGSRDGPVDDTPLLSGGRGGIIDVHLHWCVYERPSTTIDDGLAQLEALGYDVGVFYTLPIIGGGPERVPELIPGAFHDIPGLASGRACHDDVASWVEFEARWRARPARPDGRRLQTLSFLDVRSWNGSTDLAPWWGAGHTGIKDIVILEEDEAKMAMRSLRHVPGLSREAYLDRHRATFRLAEKLGVPLVWHVDLSLHGDFALECLDRHPTVRVDIPHFGFSRKAIARLFDRYPLLVTDISSMLPFMLADPEAYRGFFQRFPDRIMLGSDASPSWGFDQSLQYARWVIGLGLPDALQEAILRGNARRFLGLG
jgi:hypothetical protein